MLKFFRRKKGDGSSDEPPNSSIEETVSTTQDSAEDTPEFLPDPKSLAEDSPSSLLADPTENIPSSPPAREGWFSRLKNQLRRTRSGFAEGLAQLFLGKKTLDDELLRAIQTKLITADVGVDASKRIIDSLTSGITRKELKDPMAVYEALQNALTQILIPCEQPLIIAEHKPYVILMIGVNGAGKTTTIGKLANLYQSQGLSVMLAAGDTFRAAAVEQLQIWGARNQVPVVAQHTGADSASVIFDAFQSAKAKGCDVLIADTAGRLHTRDNLMDELKKVKRVIQKLDPHAPHEIMLVLDAGTGQNGLIQAEKFHQALGVTGITLTKLDGTAKGGIIFAIADKLKLPLRFIGIGEQRDDLRPFEAKSFVEALFTPDKQE